MTEAQFYYTQAVNLEYANEAYEETVRSNISVTNNDIYRWRLICKRFLATIINDYFQITSLTDTNFFTTAEIEDVMFYYCLLCDVDINAESAITDVTYAVSYYWDDTRIWADTDIWTEHA